MADTALVETPQAEVAVQSEAVAMISMIERAAANPDVDPDKLERLYALHERMQDKASEKSFYSAMAEMQPHLPVVEHTKKIGYTDKKGNDVVKGTYTPWEDIDELVRPVYTKYGFGLSFRVEQSPNTPVCITAIVMHCDGHKTETTIQLPADSSGSKNAVQAVGSAITYGKRYAACAALNITTRGVDGETDDDDGEKAGQEMNASQAKKHELWEKLEGEMKHDNRSKAELREWYGRIKQHRREWHNMPKPWKMMFENECLIPYSETLPEVAS
jgi:hypothetical protein